MSGLERDLLRLGHELELPPAPDLAAPVLAQLERRRRPLLRRRALVLALAALVVALVAAALAAPGARSAFPRFLHVGGERIALVDELPSVPARTGLEATLGEPVTLDEARRRAGFALRELGERPDRVYLSPLPQTVWFLYGAPDRVRLLVAQSPRLAVDAPLLAEKLAGRGTTVELLDVHGSQGVLLGGEPHVVLLRDENGIVEESARLARDVLLWEEGGVAYRLEGELTRDEALELAGALGD